MQNNQLRSLYHQSLALLTDFYQLTMAQSYWKVGLADREAVFHLFFRRNPFNSGYSVACGLGTALEFLGGFRYAQDDIDYLGSLQGNDGHPLFQPDFLEYLRKIELKCSLDAIPEGSVVFAYEPLLRVQGPLLQCQLLETPLLNIINFQTLIATKATRICRAARGEPVLEFGLRRAQGIDGGLSASRAAFIGGCAATSNVLAGKLFGLPVRGTHAHSWVMTFESELESFRAYARALPNNCVFLVDTYDTLQGIQAAIEIGKDLKRQGHRLAGIRLDSGDLAQLSRQARRLLDEAGFNETVIVASNNLDEHVITSLKNQRAKISVWGVGTRLATGHDQGALSGVYKLSAIRTGGRWKYKLKLSEQTLKINIPGILGIRRYRKGTTWMGDVIYDQQLGIDGPCSAVDVLDATRREVFPAGTPYDELLRPVIRQGQMIDKPDPLLLCRERCRRQLHEMKPGIRRFLNPAYYPVGLEERLHKLKTDLILQGRGAGSDGLAKPTARN